MPRGGCMIHGAAQVLPQRYGAPSIILCLQLELSLRF
jgi:hypothetical protein